MHSGQEGSQRGSEKGLSDKLMGRGVQSCELKKKLFFEILFAAPIGTLVRFAGPPGRHSRLNHHAVVSFYVEILGDPFFRRHLPFSLRNNTHRKFAEKIGEKIQRNFFAFRCVFRSVFFFSLATP